jgi:hypothetical protein
MANTYNIGGTTTPINLEAGITTTGLAASRASVLDLSETIPDIAVAHSDDATGNISNQPIGDYTILKGKRLTVYTKVSLPGDDAPTRAIQAAAIAASYTLSSGDDGTTTYNNPNSTYTDPDVALLFVVDLT